MRRAAVVIALALAILPAAAQADGGQPGITGGGGTPAVFKYLHFLAGLSLGLSAAQLVESTQSARLPADSPWLLPLVAVSTAAAAGVGKEILDSTGFGDPRFSDIVVTTVGGIAAAAYIAYAQSLYPPTDAGRLNSGAFVLTTAGLLALPVIAGFVREMAAYVERRRGASTSPAGPTPAP